VRNNKYIDTLIATIIITVVVATIALAIISMIRLGETL